MPESIHRYYISPPKKTHPGSVGIGHFGTDVVAGLQMNIF